MSGEEVLQARARVGEQDLVDEIDRGGRPLDVEEDGADWCGTVNTGIVKLASLTAQVRRDSVTVSGRSSSWPAGTVFRP